MQYLHHRRLSRSLGSWMLYFGLGSVACSAEGGGTSRPPVSKGATPITSNSATGGAAGAPTLQLGGSNGASQPADAESCQGEVYQGAPIPVDTYFLVDSSGSMAEPADTGTKWQVVSKALTSFLSTAPNADDAVGIGYFPNGGISACTMGEPGCVCIPYTPLCVSNTGGSCSPSDYRPAVELSLPSSVTRVIADLGAHQLSGGTPTRPAVEGTLQYLQQWASTHPERQVVLVLATDGEPTGCDRNQPQDIASIAAAAWGGPHRIRTFVLGVGAGLRSLDVVAQAGGTDQALLVDPSGNLASQFSEALENIRRESSVACDFAIPTGANGAPVDAAKVNVRVTPVTGPATLVSQTFMSDSSNCDADGGWYYDRPAAPTRITLCESTCNSAQGGSVQIQYGCDTVVRPPR